MRGVRFVVALALGAAMSGCAWSPSLTESKPSMGLTDPGPAKVATPLEARDALSRLNVFGECSDPSAPGRDYMGPEVSLVVCYILPTDMRSGIYAGRHVLVAVARDDWAAIRGEICSYNLSDLRDASREFPLVTDDATFWALGALNEQGTTSNPWGWPDEVWPEDVQRALGGEVLSFDEFCRESVAGDSSE